MGLFDIEHQIFEDESVLAPDYMPEEVYERDDQIEKFARALAPMQNGCKPNNVLVHGGTGVGKTVSTKHVLEEFKETAEENDDFDFELVFKNARGASSYDLTVSIVNELAQTQDDEIPSSGLSEDTARERLFKNVEKTGAENVLIVIDEIDSLGTDDDLIYHLSRTNEDDSDADINDTNISLIGISNDFKYKQDLSMQTNDSFCERTIVFSDYNANELATILEKRVEKAYVDGVFPEKALRKAAAIAAQDSGSARNAIDLCYLAGQIARQNDESEVTVEHVEEARVERERSTIKEEMATLARQRQLALFALAKLARRGETPADLDTIREVYSSICKRYDAHELARRTMQEKVRDLETVGIIRSEERNKGARGGRKYFYELAVDLSIVTEVLREDSMFELDMENTSLDSY
jgi:cell division control protein 6